MAVIKNTPAQRIINGKIINTSEVAVVSEPFYETHGESCIVIRGVEHSKVRLDRLSTDHTIVKAMTKVTIVPDEGLIDEQYDEILIDGGACVELRFCAGTWYIISSDGLKN